MLLAVCIGSLIKKSVDNDFKKKKAGTFSIQMDTTEDKDMSTVGSVHTKMCYIHYIKCLVSAVILVP